MSSDPSPPRDRDDRERSRLDRIVPDLVKKLVDVGVEKLADGPESLRHLLSDLKLPKEAIQLLTAQVDETKKEVTRVLARELREFLEQASLADELTKLLSGLTLEVKTQVRFVPNPAASGRPRPEVKTKVGVHVDADAATAESEQDHTKPVPTPVRQPSSAPTSALTTDEAGMAEQENSK